jgi:hypothetical protein
MNFKNIYDPGDRYDTMKWDFPEISTMYKVNKYPYGASSQQNAHKLSEIRKRIDRLCNRIEKDRKN